MNINITEYYEFNSDCGKVKKNMYN